MTPLEKVTERVTRQGHPDAKGTPTPLLSLEEFFEGNDVTGSIGCNLDGSPPPSRFYELFELIAAKPEVKDIRVQITMFDDPDWPFSDTVFIMTSASPEEVETWFSDDLKPDEISVGFARNSYEQYMVPPGTQPICCWWD
jgi:hypothetical protein